MSRKYEIMQFMNRKIAYIGSLSQAGEGKALLANLRRGVGLSPGERPELFGILLTEMPDEFLSQGTDPTREEWSCYIALTLYAMHQQGNDAKSASVHTDENVSIGLAMSRFAAGENDSNAKDRMAARLQAIAASKDMRELSYHLRSVIQLLKSSGISLNYAQLAGDLYEYQFPESRSGLFLKWGQDFYRKNKKDEA